MNNELFSSINDVSHTLDLPAYTLRYWEKQFPTVVRPVTGAGGRRYYRAETVERLRKIKELLYEKRLTIAGVKKLIHDGDFVEMITVPESAPDDVDGVNVAPITQESKGFELPGAASVESGDSGLFDTLALVPRPLDTAKIDLAIGLLKQAEELLE